MNLPNARNNDYSQDVYGVVVFAKNLQVQGKINMPCLNVFLALVRTLKEDVITKNVTTRLTICEVLSVAGFKLIEWKVAKLLTDVHGDSLNDISDGTESLNGKLHHVCISCVCD